MVGQASAGRSLSIRAHARTALLREPLEKRIVLPLRARRAVGHPLQQAHHNPVELRRRCLIHRLIQIVGRLVIAVADKIVEDLVFRGAELVPELERQRRHARANKAVLIAPDEAVLVGFLIGLHLYAILLGRLGNAFAQGRFRHPLHLDPFQIEERHEHIQVDVGDNVLPLHCRPRREIPRAEFALLLRRHRQEHDRPLGLGAALLHDARHLQNRRDSRRVVHRAVIDRVAIDRASHAHVIQVRRHDDVLVLQFRIRPRQHPHHVGRFQRFALHRRLGAQRSHQRKLGQRLVLPGELQYLVHRVAAPREKLIAALPRDRDRHLLTGGFLQLRIRQQERFLRTAPAALSAPAPGPPRIHDRRCSDGARRLQNRPTLRRTAYVRLHRPRRVQGSRAGYVHPNPAPPTDTGQIVVLGFRHAQSVTHEHHRGYRHWRQVRTAALCRVLPVQDFFRALAHNRDARFFFHHLTRLELHRLEIPRRPGRLQSERLHFSGDIFRGFAVALAACVPPLQFVIRQKLDVRPPPVALRHKIGPQQSRRAQRQDYQRFHVPHHYLIGLPRVRVRPAPAHPPHQPPAGDGKLKLISVPECRNWQTNRTQNPAHFTGRVGSSPTSGTIPLWSNLPRNSLILRRGVLPSLPTAACASLHSPEISAGSALSGFDSPAAPPPLPLRLRASASKSRVGKHPSHRHTEPNCEYPRRRAECILRVAWVNPTPTPTPEVDFTTSVNESSVVRLVLKICWLLFHAWRSSSPASKSRGRKLHRSEEHT